MEYKQNVISISWFFVCICIEYIPLPSNNLISKQKDGIWSDLHSTEWSDQTKEQTKNLKYRRREIFVEKNIVF